MTTDNVFVVSTGEYQALRMVEAFARTLFARYPLDSDEEMMPRWRSLGLFLVEVDRARQTTFEAYEAPLP